MTMASTDIQDTRQLFLWLMGCMYMFAFGSLYIQIPGLYGPNGLTPVYNVIPTNNDNSSILDRLMEPRASVVLFSQDLDLPPHVVMELCCVVGTLLGLLVMMSRIFRVDVIFVLLWALYLSVYKVGQVFMHFQWDILLLEAGVLTIFVAPTVINYRFWKRPVSRPFDGAALWLVRWLLFRLMFASGIVKLTSMCPTWWGLTALNWHYESQCIPTPLAWYAHQLPEWFQKLSVVGTYFIEIGVPFLFFVPVRSLRLFAFWNQVFFQVCIILTGNYNFFNLLTITLCVSLLDDRAIAWIPGWRRKIKVPMNWSRKLFSRLCSRVVLYTLGKLFVFVGVVSGMIAATVYLFKIVVDTESLSIRSTTGFTPDQFNKALSYAVPIAAGVGAVSLALELVYALWESVSQRGFVWKIWSLFQTVIGGAIVVALFSLSLVSLGNLDSSFSQSIPSVIYQAHGVLDEFSITSSYGLFRRMTGVGGRPELIIEGKNDEGEWREYDFLFKPGRIDEAPPFVAPHQPRLDWQMWFAALGTYQHNPWLVNLVYRLLIGQREVMDLLPPPPFAEPPKFIRVQLYHYHYTEYDYNKPLLSQSDPWWRRELQKEYTFPLTQHHSGLEDYLKQNNFNKKSTPRCVLPICSYLDQLRLHACSLPPTHLLLALFSTALLVNCTTAIIGWLLGTSENKKKKNKNGGKPQDKASTNQSQSSSSAPPTKPQASGEQGNGGGASKRRRKKNKEKREE